MIKNCQLATGIGNLKWPKCSKLCALSDEMSPPIQFRSQAAFSDSLELHLLALETADTFLTKRHNTNKFLPPSLNIALWAMAEPWLIEGFSKVTMFDSECYPLLSFRRRPSYNKIKANVAYVRKRKHT